MSDSNMTLYEITQLKQNTCNQMSFTGKWASDFNEPRKI